MGNNLITDGGDVDVYFTKYKSYVAIIDQSMSDTFSNEDLVIGQRYSILSNTTGVFTTVGSDGDTPKVSFTATGTSPTWGDAVLVRNIDPVATVLNSSDSNYLGDIAWEYRFPGTYFGVKTGAFTLNKTYLSATNNFNISNGTIITMDHNNGSIDEVSIQIFNADKTGTNTYADVMRAYVEIRVYP